MCALFIYVCSQGKPLLSLSPTHSGTRYLTGNPCSQYEGYRAYVLHTVPQVLKLDGVVITRSERLRGVFAHLLPSTPFVTIGGS
jgi:hypothetical protein